MGPVLCVNISREMLHVVGCHDQAISEAREEPCLSRQDDIGIDPFVVGCGEPFSVHPSRVRGPCASRVDDRDVMPEIDPQLVDPWDAVEGSIPKMSASELIVGNLGDGDQPPLALT